MAAQQQKKFNNKNRNNNDNRAPKPVTKTLPIIISGKDQKGNDYNVDSCAKIIGELQEANVFDKLSIFAVIARSFVTEKEDAKGTMNLARIAEVDGTDMRLTFFGKNIDLADRVENMAVVPRVRVDFNTGDVLSILNFEVVDMMEA